MVAFTVLVGFVAAGWGAYLLYAAGKKQISKARKKHPYTADPVFHGFLKFSLFAGMAAVLCGTLLYRCAPAIERMDRKRHILDRLDDP
jgi:hypothetical protein